MQRAGSSRITDAAWYPEIQLMRDQGMKTVDIAAALHLSERRIRQISQGGRVDGGAMVRLVPEPIPDEALDADILPMKEFSADAFELFYNRFSGKVLATLHKRWVQEFIDHRNLLLNVPPRHAKSHIFAVWLPIWLLCRNRNEQILLISKGKDLSTILSYEISYHFEYDTDLIKAFGRFAPERSGDSPWRPSRGELLLLGRTRDTKSGQLSLQCRGSGQQVLGMEATVAIIDDGTDAEISRSDTEREKHINWLREQVLTRIEPSEPGGASGRAVVVGQRVHLRDMYGELEQQRIMRGPRKGEPTWFCIKMPAVIRWPDEDPEDPEPLVLWPEKWTYDELMESYERVGHGAFECMYQQDPLPEGAAFVRQEWWENCRDYDRPAFRGVQIPEETEEYLPVVRVMSIDPSPTQFNALVVSDVLCSRDTFQMAVLEFKTWKGGSRELQTEINRCITEYAPQYLILESSTMTKWFEGEPFFQHLKNRLTVLPHTTGRNKADPELGVESLAADIEAGRIRTPYGDTAGKQMTEEFEWQANVYGHGYEFDLLMAAWFIKWNYRKLLPRRTKSQGFTRKSKDGWGYISRENKVKVQSQDELMKMWRKRHGVKRSA
jgi:hypothetical protein